MPVGIQEIHPFLAFILTGGAVKVGVGSRIGLVNEAAQVVFHSGFVFSLKAYIKGCSETRGDSSPLSNLRIFFSQYL